MLLLSPFKFYIDKQKHYKNYNNGNKDFICHYCEDCTCLACNKHVYDWQEGVLCDCCEQWIHRKCARLANQEYEELETKEEEIWHSRTCTKDYSHCRKSMIHNYIRFWLSAEDLKTIQLNKDITEIKNKIKATTCNVCNKNNEKGVLWKTSFPQLHRKCCKLKLSDIHDIGKDTWGWECLTCTTEMFPFTTVEDKEITKMALFQTFIANAKQLQI